MPDEICSVYTAQSVFFSLNSLVYLPIRIEHFRFSSDPSFPPGWTRAVESSPWQSARYTHISGSPETSPQDSLECAEYVNIPLAPVRLVSFSSLHFTCLLRPVTVLFPFLSNSSLSFWWLKQSFQFGSAHTFSFLKTSSEIH